MTGIRPRCTLNSVCPTMCWCSISIHADASGPGNTRPALACTILRRTGLFTSKGNGTTRSRFTPATRRLSMKIPSGILWIGTEDAIVSLDLGSARDEVNADSVVRHARFRTIPCNGFNGGSLKLERWDDSSLIVASVGGLFVVNRHTGSDLEARPPFHQRTAA